MYNDLILKAEVHRAGTQIIIIFINKYPYIQLESMIWGYHTCSHYARHCTKHLDESIPFLLSGLVLKLISKTGGT